MDARPQRPWQSPHVGAQIQHGSYFFNMYIFLHWENVSKRNSGQYDYIVRPAEGRKNIPIAFCECCRHVRTTLTVLCIWDWTLDYFFAQVTWTASHSQTNQSRLDTKIVIIYRLYQWLQAPALSKDLRDRVVQWCIEKNWSYRKLAELAGCSIGTIANILMYHRIYRSS